MSIADFCPASEFCQAQLTRLRQEQRSKLLRLYDAVEIGPATNYVADLLLQYGTGKNALALLTSIFPVMSKAASNAAITFLFRKAGVPPDYTPGVGQLERLREALMPMIIKTTFKDKVLQYHAWMIRALASLKQQRSVDGTEDVPSLKNVYDSIPHEELVSNILSFMHKVKGSQNLIYEHHGLAGAAWSAAFARDILGLLVCVFSDAESTSPISGDLKTAKVIIRPYSITSKCLIRNGNTVEDSLEITSLSKEERLGWVIDLGRTNFFDLHVSPNDAHLKEMFGAMTGPLTQSCVEILARSFYWKKEEKRLEGFQKFPMAHIPLIRAKALTIMHSLGFDCSTVSLLKSWKDYFCFHQREESTESKSYEPSLSTRRNSIKKTRTSAHLAPTRKWKKRFGDAAIDAHAPLCQGDEFNAYGRKAISCLVKAVTFASTLAFTNWGKDFRSMSVNYLQREDALDETHPLLWRDIIHSMLTDDISSGFIYGELIEHILDITTDTPTDAHTSDFTDDKNNLISTSLSGTVFIRTMAVESSPPSPPYPHTHSYPSTPAPSSPPPSHASVSSPLPQPSTMQPNLSKNQRIKSLLSTLSPPSPSVTASPTTATPSPYPPPSTSAPSSSNQQIPS